MNIMWLKYAAEVAKCGSFSAAAKNLFMSQPNLSRAIKELESFLGITIFDRSAKGIALTAQGEEFMHYAKSILSQVDQIENMYSKGTQTLRFLISVPRASYISAAFAAFSQKVSREKHIEFFYKETNTFRSIQNILEADYRLGIIRFESTFDKYFYDKLEQNNLHYEPLTEFRYKIIMNENNPLASKETLRLADLKDQTIIAHADPYVPSLPVSFVKKHELQEEAAKRIYVFERASQFELLAANTDMYMWVSSVPETTLHRYSLVQKNCSENKRIYKDVLIYKEGYTLTDIDKLFIEELHASIARHLV